MASLRDIVDSLTIFRVESAVREARGWPGFLGTRVVFLGADKMSPREIWRVSGALRGLKREAEGPLKEGTEGAVSSFRRGLC
jgi:hypothetical protein